MWRRGKSKEAVIEYKNAVQAGPKDSALRLTLAMAALEGKDIRTAKVKELEAYLFFLQKRSRKKVISGTSFFPKWQSR